jgi:hypothetical protein
MPERQVPPQDRGESPVARTFDQVGVRQGKHGERPMGRGPATLPRPARETQGPSGPGGGGGGNDGTPPGTPRWRRRVAAGLVSAVALAGVGEGINYLGNRGSNKKDGQSTLVANADASMAKSGNTPATEAPVATKASPKTEAQTTTTTVEAPIFQTEAGKILKRFGYDARNTCSSSRPIYCLPTRI